MDQKIVFNHIVHPYLKSLALLAILTSIGACGGGGGGSSTSASIKNPVIVAPPGELVSGRGMKGVVVNADVSAYEIIDNQIASDPLITTTTDNEGNYQLQLPHQGIKMLQIVLSGRADGSTTVRCDISAGCMQMAYFYKFGENYPVDSSFVLSGISGVDGIALSMHITPLTHIVAEIVKSELAARVISSSSSSGSILANANSKVALAFDLDDVSFTSLVPIDITRITDYDNLQTNQLNANIVGAAVSTLDDPTRADDGIADSLNRIVEMIKSNEMLMQSSEFVWVRASVMQTAMQLRLENPNLQSSTMLAEIELKLKKSVDDSMLLADILKPPAFAISEFSLPAL